MAGQTDLFLFSILHGALKKFTWCNKKARPLPQSGRGRSTVSLPPQISSGGPIGRRPRGGFPAPFCRALPGLPASDPYFRTVLHGAELYEYPIPAGQTFTDLRERLLFHTFKYKNIRAAPSGAEGTALPGKVLEGLSLLMRYGPKLQACASYVVRYAVILPTSPRSRVSASSMYSASRMD